MSVIVYNGVTLPLGMHTDFRQEAVYDEVGGVDWYCTRFDITVQCLVNTDYFGQLCPDLAIAGNAPANAADVMNVIRSRLLKPRRSLSIKYNGIELIPKVPTNAGFVDVKNGPQPQFCTCPLVSNNTFFLSWRVIAHYWDNITTNRDSPITTNKTGAPVLYNRWTETVDINDCNFSRRTREGKFTIRSDNVDGKTADQLRSQFAVVGVPEGFLRDNASYSISADGLSIQYRITDTEPYKMPPNPAFRARASYVETCGKQGIIRHGLCRVNLKADKATPQAKLIEVALQVAAKKLNIAGRGVQFRDDAKGFHFLENASIELDMYEENSVSVEIRIRYMGGKARIQGIAGFSGFAGTREMTITPLSDIPNGPPQPRYTDRGSAGLLLQAAAYYDPSVLGVRLGVGTPTTNQDFFTGDQNTQMTAGRVPGTAGVNRET